MSPEPKSAKAGCIAVSLYLVGQSQAELTGGSGVYTLSSAFREGSFQALSMQTSTGFVTANYDRWPFPPQMFILILMFVVGMEMVVVHQLV